MDLVTGEIIEQFAKCYGHKEDIVRFQEPLCMDISDWNRNSNNRRAIIYKDIIDNVVKIVALAKVAEFNNKILSLFNQEYNTRKEYSIL